METFRPGGGGGGELETRPPVEFLAGGRCGGKSQAAGDAFNSWNDYLGLATLITKAVGEEGTRCGPQPRVHVRAAPGGEEEEDEEEEEEDEEEDEEEEAAVPCFEGALRLHGFELCGGRHPGERFLEQRFAELRPFSGRAGPAALLFGCSPPPPPRDRSPHAWAGGGLLEGRLPAPPRLLKPELQVCVFCRNNKEAVALYTTHILKGPDGRVLCPVLRRYTCPLCGASGDNAHTIKYCPLSKAPPARPPLRHARTLLGKKLR